MTFAAPEWFFLLPLLAVVGWRFRALRLFEPVRAAALIVCVFALADPRMRIGGSGLDLWVLTDRSDSAAGATTTQATEVETILQRSKRPDDRVFFVDYAVDAVRRDQGDPVFRGGSYLTRTNVALDFTLAQIENLSYEGEKRAARLLVMGDGYATEPLGDAAERILNSGVPVDYRLTSDAQALDYRVERVTAPNRVLSGEAFLVEFFIIKQGVPANATDATEQVPWEVMRDGRVAASGVATLRDNVTRVQLTDRLGAGGAVRYEVRINPTHDAHPENNSGNVWVEVAGGPRALLVTLYPDDPLATLLTAQGFEVARVTDAETLTASALTGARLVIINNVPAHRVGADFLRGLEFFVREQGGGLLMSGGENSFGAGGYFASAIDPLLPVSMEMRKEHRRLATAMAIVLDRSGSMAASAGGGQTKMDLANTGAARAIELLGDYDMVSVHAIDSSPHEIVPMTQVGPNRDKMMRAVRRVASEGGGIFVGVGLHAGWDELQKASTGQKHMILFADAADAEEPDDYKATLDEMRKAGATVSVIGMGTRSDSDAALLEEVAKLGGGRCFFGATAAELPAIFAQETVSVARSAFIKEDTGTQGTAGWAEIAARTPAWLSVVDGYNLSYLRAGATASLVTTDEYQAPLVAAWSRGAGRVAAISFPLGDKHSDKVRAWSGLGDFEQTLTRWIAGDDAPPGLGLRTETTGNRMTVDLFYDDSWATRIAQSGPVAVLAETNANAAAGERMRELVWEKIEPGHFRTFAELTPGRVARGVVRVGRDARSAKLAFGPLSVSGSPEWAFDRARVQELRQLSTRSGGVERLDLATVWDAQRPASTRSVRSWMLVALIALALIDAALTRLGVSLVRRAK